GDEPVVAMVASQGGHAPEPVALPGGLFCAGEHDSLDAGLVACVERQTGLALRQTRQISTASARAGIASLVLSISYLALLGPERCRDRGGVAGRSWYQFFPGKDWRQGRRAFLKQETGPPLRAWAAAEPACASERLDRNQRVRLCFGLD